MPKHAAFLALVSALLLVGCGSGSSPAQDNAVGKDVPSAVPDSAPDVPVAPFDELTTADAPKDLETTSTPDLPVDQTTTPDATADPGPVLDTAQDAPDATDLPSDPDATADLPPDSAASNCSDGCPPGTLCLSGQCSSMVCGAELFNNTLIQNEAAFSEQLLISQLPDLTWAPSTIYTWVDFLTALHGMCTTGVGSYTFWTGEDTSPNPEETVNYGLVNIAAFLAQSMKETIKYDACDENNWDQTNGYKLSNACGQLGQNYANYDCDMACPQDPSLQMSAVTNAKWYGAPGPLFCAPDSELIAAGLSTDGSTGYWNYSSDCWPYPATELGFTPSDLPPYMRPACEVYAGQKGGGYVFDGSGGSVQGCCWWGRGVIQTTGRCNFGTLNHYLGQTHLDPAQFSAPDSVLYPGVNFCQNPEVICASTEHPELKWIAGLFYWMTSVQTYEQDGWNYKQELQNFVDGGMQGDAFIDAVSGIVNRGCHNPPCGTGPVDGAPERRENFIKALTVMGLK
jgi:hypothetical protein